MHPLWQLEADDVWRWIGKDAAPDDAELLDWFRSTCPTTVRDVERTVVARFKR